MPELDHNNQLSQTRAGLGDSETGQNVNILLSYLTNITMSLGCEIKRGVSATQGLIKGITAHWDLRVERSMVRPDKIADYLLVESRERGDNPTNLKIQKLLYYAQAWYLANRDKPLFDEDFKAWIHGPVLPSQYARFKDYTWKPITEEVEAPELPEHIQSHLDEILDVFGVENAVALEAMTHAEQPWQEARGKLAPDEPSAAVIKKETMKLYYRSL